MHLVYILLLLGILCFLFLHLTWGVAEAKCILITATAICMSVCLSLTAFPHCCTDPDVSWGSGKGWMPSSCALLGRFAIGAQVSLPWQRSAERKTSASACTRSVPGLSRNYPASYTIMIIKILLTMLSLWLAALRGSTWRPAAVVCLGTRYARRSWLQRREQTAPIIVSGRRSGRLTNDSSDNSGIYLLLFAYTGPCWSRGCKWVSF